MLEVKGLAVSYRERLVLTDVNVTFEKGKITGIIGVNGCGKSTLLKAMLGLLPVTCGEVLIDGAALQTLSRNEIARKAAYLAQGKNTPDMTVAQMVLHGRFPYLSYPRRYGEKDRKFAMDAMKAVGIDHLADKPLYQLSGGMRQMAYIAMALAQDTEYILLDEPTTYLDIANQLEIMKILRQLADSGKGVIAVMHDLALAFNVCDFIVAVENGGAVKNGTPEIMRPCVRKMFGVEMGQTETGKYYCEM